MLERWAPPHAVSRQENEIGGRRQAEFFGYPDSANYRKMGNALNRDFTVLSHLDQRASIGVCHVRVLYGCEAGVPPLFLRAAHNSRRKQPMTRQSLFREPRNGPGNTRFP